MPITRVSFASTQLAIRDNIFRAQRHYREASVPATTGRAVNFLSDNPLAITRIFSLRNQALANQQYQRNISESKTRMNFNETQLAEVGGVLNRSREIILRANDPTVSVSLRAQLSTQLGDLKTELLGYANAKLEGSFIFGGTDSDSTPFSGTPTVYNGTTTSVTAQITRSLAVQTNIDPKKYFMGNIATAASTDLLTNLHTDSGGNLGALAGDTITMAGTVTTAFSTTYAVTATSTYANLAAALQVAIRAAGVGTETVAVQANGSLLVTAGTTAITGLTSSISGKAAFNTAFAFTTPIAASGTGTSAVLDGGTGDDVFDLFDDLQTAVTSANATTLETALSRLDSTINQFLDARAEVATRTQQIDASEISMGDERVRLATDLAMIEDVDISQALSTLVTRETALRLVFASSSRVLSAIGGVQLQV